VHNSLIIVLWFLIFLKFSNTRCKRVGGEAAACLLVALSSPQRNRGGSAVLAWATILSGDSSGSPRISGHLLFCHLVDALCLSIDLWFLVLECAVGFIVDLLNT
jgi:hypothetical protein